MIIASILLLKAKSVASDETRTHLLDAHQRVRAIADIQRYLQPSFREDRIEIAPYLTNLCQSLAASMVEPGNPHRISIEADEGATTSSEAVSLGLITTELIINALKHAFADGRVGAVEVAFTDAGAGWQLSVADNGIGIAAKTGEGGGSGLGTTIIESLAKQLGGEVRTNSSPAGTRVVVTTGPLAEKTASAAS
jgi:chemotaxis protein methyltransferase CheR